MKTFGLILLALSAAGMIQLLVAWQTGTLTAMPPIRYHVGEVLTVKRAEKPEEFKRLVAYQIIVVTTLFGFGMICAPRWRAT